MSKILKMVEAHQTGNRYAEIPQVEFTATTSQVPYSYSSGLIYEYDCKLTLGGRVLAKDEQDLSYQLERLRIQLAHELYGEFKETIVDMYKALQSRDITEAMNLNDKLYTAMFVDV